MTLPAILLGFVFSTLFGAAFHFWRGGNLGRLLLYLLLAWIGFWLGHFVASLAEITFGTIGSLHLGMASISALVVLLAGHWLFLSGKSDE